MSATEISLVAADGRVVCDHCVVASRPLRRMRGLLGRRTLPQGEGILLKPAGAIHTFFMRFAIDVVFLDRDLTVVGVTPALAPWRTAVRSGATAVLELPAGEAERRQLRVGETLASQTVVSRRAPTLHRSPVGNELGQAVVATVLFLTVLLGMAAMVVDVGGAYLVQRKLQASADAAALAGAQELPQTAAATALAREFSAEDARKNEYEHVSGVTSGITTFCRAGSSCSPVNAIAVTQTASVATNFARVFGLDTFTVHARGVAQIQSGATPWAIFAYDSDCGSLVLKLNGGDTRVDGAIHSNGKLEVNGNDFTAGYTSAGGPNDCEPVIDGENIDLGGGSDQPVIENELQPWPRFYTKSEFTCTYSAQKFNFNTTGQTIPTGTYCASELFEANGNNQRGTITVLAPEIKIDGDGQFFRPHQLDVLFFATGTKELVLDGNDYDWEGVIFHPKGRIKLNGDSSSILKGLIEGLEVEINGNGFQMVGQGPDTGERRIELVE